MAKKESICMSDVENLITEIETYLEVTANRQMFTSQEIQDLLLDLRSLAAQETPTGS